MAEAVASKPGPPPLDPDSVWTKIQQAGVTVPADVIDKLAELDLELSEGEKFSLIGPRQKLLHAWRLGQTYELYTFGLMPYET